MCSVPDGYGNWPKMYFFGFSGSRACYVHLFCHFYSISWNGEAEEKALIDAVKPSGFFWQSLSI
jgi:hypothetical protein